MMEKGDFVVWRDPRMAKTEKSDGTQANTDASNLQWCVWLFFSVDFTSEDPKQISE